MIEHDQNSHSADQQASHPEPMRTRRDCTLNGAKTAALCCIVLCAIPAIVRWVRRPKGRGAAHGLCGSFPHDRNIINGGRIDLGHLGLPRALATGPRGAPARVHSHLSLHCFARHYRRRLTVVPRRA